MRVTEQDAAAIYAQACVAWYGAKARRIVREQVKRFERKGDLKSMRAWNQVAAEISKLSAGGPKRVAAGKLY